MPAVVFLQFSDKKSLWRWASGCPNASCFMRGGSESASKPTEFLKMTAVLHKSGHSLDGEGALRRLPRGFDTHAESPVAEYLKLNSFFVIQEMSDAQLRSAKLVGEVFAVRGRDARAARIRLGS